MTAVRGDSFRAAVAILLLGCMSPPAAVAQTFGLERRETWTTSRVRGFPDPPPPLRLTPAFPRLQFRQPIACGRYPDSDLLWVATHDSGYGGPGHLWRFRDDEAVEAATAWFEIPDIIYGLAFHPNFAQNGFVFIGCNGRSDALDTVATRVLRLRLSTTAPFEPDPDSLKVVIEWPSNGHNGGDVAFGPDGMLYVSAGDGTSDSDGNLAGQDLSTLPGSILRIDTDHPDSDAEYSSPADNPFVGHPGARAEIWAYGFRNPWRITFDRDRGDLWVGNNGQDLRETVHLVHRGDNCGWSVKEGSAPFQLQRKRGPTPIVLPTVEHHHAEARSLTGGVVYSGSLLPRLVGWYLYGDYSTGNVWAAKATGGRAIVRHVARSSAQIAGFGLDSHGEVLLVDHGGSILRLEPRPDDATPLTKFPRKLSETGLFSSVPDHLPASGVIPYSVNAALWSDGAAKERFLAIPGNKTIGFKPKGSWEFPDGTVLVKTFSLPVGADADAQFRRIETRLLTRQDGEWFGYSYLWNDDQSDAELLPAAGGTRTYQIRNKQHRVPQSWRFPSRSECMVCHTRAASFVLGLSTEQLNGDHDYGHVRANQLDTLIHIGLLDKAPDRAATTSPALVDPNDDSTPIRDRARAWLHVNCAHCHVKEGGGNSRLDLRFDTPLQLMHLLNQPPQHDAFGIPVPAIVAGGSPERSVLRKRIAIRGPGQMPPLGSLVVDDAGLRLIERWINKLPSETAP